MKNKNKLGKKRHGSSFTTQQKFNAKVSLEDVFPIEYIYLQAYTVDTSKIASIGKIYQISNR